MSEFPQMGKKLFVSGGHQSEFAHIAWGNMETQFYGYVVGYKKAADTIILNAVEKGDISTLDTHVFPACFLYRQYIELALKDLYLSNSGVSKEEKAKILKSCQHNLKKIWAKVKVLIIEDFPDDDMQVIEAVENYIHQFAEIDSNSFAFRYPITKDLNLVNEKEKFINLVNLAERMDELESFLSAVNMGMSVHRDCESEMMSYYASEMDSYY